MVHGDGRARTANTEDYDRKPHTTPFDVRVPPEPDARFGVISDVDNTILETGVQRVGAHGAARPSPGPRSRARRSLVHPELYRDLAAGGNPLFYVSSSPWNLHPFLMAFLRHRNFPLGPVLLRDLLGSRQAASRSTCGSTRSSSCTPTCRSCSSATRARRTPRSTPTSSGSRPNRVLAIYIREVRLDPGDGRVEQVTDLWDHDVPFVLAADSDAVRRHAMGLGLLS